MSWLARYCVVVGCLDATTGVLLLADPGVVLRLLGVDSLPGEPVLLRWIGAFVAGVGLAYVYPLLTAAAMRTARWRVVLEVTALQRLTVFAFVSCAIAMGWLTARWASVAGTDLVLAAAQLAMLARWPRS